MIAMGAPREACAWLTGRGAEPTLTTPSPRLTLADVLPAFRPRPPRAREASARLAPAQAATRRLPWHSLAVRFALPHPAACALPSSPSVDGYTLRLAGVTGRPA